METDVRDCSLMGSTPLIAKCLHKVKSTMHDKVMGKTLVGVTKKETDVYNKI